jgi:diguanylate cyclase (GGDEF)-like protein
MDSGFPARVAGVLLVALLFSAPLSASHDAILEEARLLQREDPLAALVFLDTAIEELVHAEEPDHLSRLLYLRATVARDLGHIDDALADIELIEELVHAADNPVLAANTIYLRGTIDAEQGDVVTALERFHEARHLIEGTDATGRLALITNAIGVAHNFVKDYERARRYYRQALELARAAGDETLEIHVLGNLAVAISELDGPAEGLALHREALALAKAQGNTGAIGYQLANICSRLIETSRLDEADQTCGEAASVLEGLGNARLLAATRLNLGDLRSEQGRLGEALTHYEEALRRAEGSVPTVELEALDRLVGLYERRGNHAAALNHHRRLVSLRERILQEERRELVEELEIRYEVDRREAEIGLLQLEAELQALQLQRRNWLLAALGAVFGLLVLLALVVWWASRSKARMQRRLAGEDPLTGLINRRAFDRLVRHEQERARRQDSPLTVVVADIDNFKPVNDKHGHQIGDTVLRELAARLQVALRGGDVICRWGGEEFVLLLPDTDLVGARQLVARVRKAIAERPIDTSVGPFSITLTYGVAPVADAFDAALQAADRAMYQGKRAGRDQVVVVHADGEPRGPE